jgi:hypothetical protein
VSKERKELLLLYREGVGSAVSRELLIFRLFLLSFYWMAVLIENRDIFNLLVSEWMTLKDLVNLDTAICSHSLRESFLSLLSGVQYEFPFANKIESWWKYHPVCLRWFAVRQMYESRGELNVHQKLWEKLLCCKDIDYTPLLSGVHKLRFLGFYSDFDFCGISVCSKLTHLRLCNLLQPLESLHTLPNSLTSLSLQNSVFNNSLLSYLHSCRNLKALHLKYVDFSSAFSEDFNNEQLFELLQRLDDLYILGDISPWLEVLKGNTQHLSCIQSIHFDKANCSETEMISIQNLFEASDSSYCHELTLSRMKIDLMNLLKPLRTHSLDFLHLNHVRLINAQLFLATNNQPSSAVDQTTITRVTDGSTIQLAVKKLQLSSIVGLTDVIFARLLSAFCSHLCHLHLSFCSYLTEESFEFIANHLNSLVSIDIEDKKECWDSRRTDKIIHLFSRLSKVRIILWDGWLTEAQKQEKQHSNEREIRYER